MLVSLLAVACGGADESPNASGGPNGGGATAGSGGAPGAGGSVASGGVVTSSGATSGGSDTNATGGATLGGTSAGGGGSTTAGTTSGGTASAGGGSAGAAMGGMAGSGGAAGPLGDTKTDGLVGFATVAGYGLTSTTGAGRAPVVRVTTFAELVATVKDSTPRIVEIAGTITASGGVAMVDVGSNKTIIGVGTNATISGFGLDINGWTNAEQDCAPTNMDPNAQTKNVVVRNITFTGAADDSINIQCYSHHIWIDHNTFTAGTDGSVDVKRGSDLVTVSWNRFTGTDKTMLLGHSADNGAQDRGYLRVTYHHNFFDSTNTRTPRVRFGLAHVFNNYVSSNDYFLGLGVDAKIYAEGNFVEKAKTLTQTFTESTGYHLTWASSNQYDVATVTRANSSGATMSEWLDADGSVAAPNEYRYTVDAASSLASSVRANAGAGRL